MRKIRATYEAVKGILKDGKVGVKEGRRERGRLKKESGPGQLGSLHHAASSVAHVLKALLWLYLLFFYS
jgi:hypothetical protein